jgi:hypothetical protein
MLAAGQDEAVERDACVQRPEKKRPPAPNPSRDSRNAVISYCAPLFEYRPPRPTRNRQRNRKSHGLFRSRIDSLTLINRLITPIRTLNGSPLRHA